MCICLSTCYNSSICFNDEQIAKLPEDEREDVLNLMGGPNTKGLKFRIQVSPMNCVGCGICFVQCPGKGGKKALEMVEAKTQYHHEKLLIFSIKKLNLEQIYFH